MAGNSHLLNGALSVITGNASGCNIAGKYSTAVIISSSGISKGLLALNEPMSMQQRG
jgi:hypothetical protein